MDTGADSAQACARTHKGFKVATLGCQAGCAGLTESLCLAPLLRACPFCLWCCRPGGGRFGRSQTRHRAGSPTIRDKREGKKQTGHSLQSAGGACAGAAPHLSRPFGPPTSRLVSSVRPITTAARPSLLFPLQTFSPPHPTFSRHLQTFRPLHHHPSFSPDLSSVKMPARLFVGYVFLTPCAPSTLSGSLVLTRALLPSQKPLVGC